MNKLKQLRHREISGKELNELLGDDCNYLIKFMKKNDVHYGMEYCTGPHIDIKPFNPTEFSPGIHFCHISSFFVWYDWCGDFIRRVKVPDDARVYIDEKEIKADRVILSKRKRKHVMLRKLLTNYFKDHPEQALDIIKQHGSTIKFIAQEFRTLEMMLEAVKQNGFAINYIGQEFRTLEMMLEAVKQTGFAIEYIKQAFRTPDMMLEAVKQNGLTIQCIEREFRTYDMMLIAVKQNSSAIHYIEEEFRTEEMMLFAVDQMMD